MIPLTRLNKQNIVLNADLIKWIESSPDTVITLLTGEKLVVLESCSEVVEAVIHFRRQFGWSMTHHNFDNAQSPAGE